MPKRLSDDELDELKRWLTDQQINPNKIHREFSDALPVVNLLKKFYPKLIDLHNYPPRNNTQLKIINWQTLNTKALIKLGIGLNKSMIENLAKGTPGAIESLLVDIMLLDKSNRVKGDQSSESQEQIWTENDEVMMVTVNKRVGDAIVQMPQKMILYSIYEQVVRDSSVKDSYLKSSQQKVAHLENIIRLKSERIDELCAQLAKISVRSLLNQHNIENSSPNPGLRLDQCCSKSIDF